MRDIFRATIPTSKESFERFCVCVCKIFAVAYGVQSVWARRDAWTEKIGSKFYFQAKKKKKETFIWIYTVDISLKMKTHTHTHIKRKLPQIPPLHCKLFRTAVAGCAHPASRARGYLCLISYFSRCIGPLGKLFMSVGGSGSSFSKARHRIQKTETNSDEEVGRKEESADNWGRFEMKGSVCGKGAGGCHHDRLGGKVSCFSRMQRWRKQETEVTEGRRRRRRRSAERRRGTFM